MKLVPISAGRRAGRRLVAVPQIVALAGVVVAGGVAAAQVALHTGTITGTLSLSGATYTSASVSVGNQGDSSSTQVAGGVFSLSVEGDQTYDVVSAYQHLESPNYAELRLLDKSAALSVPVGGTVNLNLSRQGGQIATHVDVSTMDVGGVTMPAGFVVGGSFTATAVQGNESITAGWTGDGPDLFAPMVATSGVTVRGNATVNVLDYDGATVLCTTTVSFAAGAPFTVAAGATTTLPFLATVDPSVCSASVLKGDVGIHNLPGNLVPERASVYALGQSQFLTGFSVQAPDVAYQFDGLAPAIYQPVVYATFGAPFNGGYMQLPSGNQQAADLTRGGVAVRDFLYDGAIAKGTLSMSGPGARFVTSGIENFYGAFDPLAPDFGPTTNGYAVVALNLADKTFWTVLTPGTWHEYSGFLGFQQTLAATDYFSTFNFASEVEINAAPGQTITFNPPSLSLAEAIVYLDVAEASGAPIVGITNPSVSAGFFDAQRGLYLTATAQTAVSNVDSPSLRVIGVPGVYTFTANGTVGGTSSQLAASTLTVGAPVSTGSGANVGVAVKDASNVNTNVALTFASVAAAGETNGAFVDVGPQLPDGYSLLALRGTDTFLSLSSSATFSGSVEVCVTYDPVGLGLDAAEEQLLRLQQYTCTGADSCDWSVQNGVLPGHNGGVAINTQTHTVCGLASSLGTFALTRQDVTQIAPDATCIGSLRKRARLATDPNVCTVLVDNVNQVAGGCADAGGGLASCTFNGQSSKNLPLGATNLSIVGTALDLQSIDSCTSYVTVADLQKPGVNCPAPVVKECTGPTTSVNLSPSCSDNCGSCRASCGCDAFRVGTTTVACNAADSATNKSNCTTSVKIVDTTPPKISLKLSHERLWPANHKLVGINLSRLVTDLCDPRPTISCTATSDEDDDDRDDGDGHRPQDVQWVNGGLLLRAERCDHRHGAGRTYTITCTARDASGNTSTASANVVVDRWR